MPLTRPGTVLAALAALVLGLTLSTGAAPVAGQAEAPEARLTSWRNPVIPGFHPDPSAVRVGDRYYLVTSSFEFFPGVPVFESGDLVHWRQVGHALTRGSQLPLEGVRPSGGIFAPTLRHHDGTFYMVTTNVTAGGNFYVTATDPAGPWSEPIWVRGQGGIDPSLFFDEDGTVYFTSTGGAPGTHERGIHQSTIDVATGELLTPPRLIWEGTGGRYPEGPHLYRIGGRYYLLISEGGTEYGHMVTLARSDSPWGPFEPCPRNPILTHRDTQMDVPVQGTGHAELVEDHEGSWWMLFLAFRPVGGGYWHHLGRETFLAPVTWDDEGWPMVNGGEPVGLEMSVPGLPAAPVPDLPVRTGFEGPLGPEWNHLRNPDPSVYSTSERPGWLTLRGTVLALDATASPTWVGRRQQHLACRVETRLDFAPGRDGDEAGLTVYRNPEHHYAIGVDRQGGQRRVFVRQVVGPSLRPVTASAPAEGTESISLRIEAVPEEYRFSFALASAPDEWKSLGSAPTRLLSSEVAHGFTGAYFALYATGNGSPAATPATFDWFDYEPLGP